jgi:uncharacterized protein
MKAVWTDERIASICATMGSVAILGTNVAAAIDKTKLTDADMNVLKEYAVATCSGYCAGCEEICAMAMPDVPIRDMMRCAMYHNGYGQQGLAHHEFASIDADIRDRLMHLDYSKAEAVCPQRLSIGQIVKETVTKLA